MTEMTSLICGIAKNESLVDLAGSTGKLEPGVEARIIDCDTGVTMMLHHSCQHSNADEFV